MMDFINIVIGSSIFHAYLASAFAVAGMLYALHRDDLELAWWSAGISGLFWPLVAGDVFDSGPDHRENGQLLRKVSKNSVIVGACAFLGALVLLNL